MDKKPWKSEAAGREIKSLLEESSGMNHDLYNAVLSSVSKHGPQTMTLPQWYLVFSEEVGEIGQAILNRDPIAVEQELRDILPVIAAMRRELNRRDRGLGSILLWGEPSLSQCQNCNRPRNTHPDDICSAWREPEEG